MSTTDTQGGAMVHPFVPGGGGGGRGGGGGGGTPLCFNQRSRDRVPGPIIAQHSTFSPLSARSRARAPTEIRLYENDQLSGQYAEVARHFSRYDSQV